jgi:putative RecB family exonuclease
LIVRIEHLRPWSFSKVQKAKRCQYEFFWRYVERREPLEKPEFMAIGSGVHFVIENALGFAVRNGRPVDRKLLQKFARAYADSEPVVTVESLEAFFPNIVKYVNAQLKRFHRSGFVELEFGMAVDERLEPAGGFKSSRVFLRGKVDLMFSKEDLLYIVDHKTGRGRDFDNKTKTQLRWYALLAGTFFPEFHRFALELHNVRYGTVRRFIFTRRDLDSFKVRLLPIIGMIEDELANRSFEELKPSPSEENCRWCDYRHICPAAIL